MRAVRESIDAIGHHIMTMASTTDEYMYGRALQLLTEERLQIRRLMSTSTDRLVSGYQYAASTIPLLYLDRISEANLERVVQKVWMDCQAPSHAHVLTLVNLFSYLAGKMKITTVQLPTEGHDEIIQALGGYPLEEIRHPSPGELMACHIFGQSMQVYRIREFASKHTVEFVHTAFVFDKCSGYLRE